MSKPLIFVTQIAGLGFILNGWTSSPHSIGHMALGIVLIILAGYAIRSRIKNK